MSSFGQAWSPSLEPVLIAAVVAGVAALSIVAARRAGLERRALSLTLLLGRLVLLAGLAVVLLNPGQRNPAASSAASVRPRLTLLLDTSTSMLTPDLRGQPRLAGVIERWLTPEALARLREQRDVELLAFDAQARPMAEGDLRRPAADLARGRETRIVDALARALDAMAPAGPPASQARRGDAILLISDGREAGASRSGAATATLPRVAAAARARGLPIHTLCVGESSAARSVAIVDVAGPGRVVVGETANLRVRIEQRGHDAETIPVRVSAGERSSQGTIPIAGRGVITLDLPLPAPRRPGAFAYTVGLGDADTSPIPSAATADRREWTGVALAVGRTLRVLLLEGEPAWDSRFFAQAMRRDSEISLTQVTRVGDETVVATGEPGAAEAGAHPGPAVTWPFASSSDWARYDVIVLGRQVERLLEPAAAESLAASVRAGGHLFFLRGGPVSESASDGADRQVAATLASLAPAAGASAPSADAAALASASMRMTLAGKAHPALRPESLGLAIDEAFPQLAPPDDVAALAARPASTTLVTLGDAGPPLWLAMPVGRGSAVMLNGQGWWRWSLQPPEGAGHAPLYDAAMVNLVRWLALGGDFVPGQPWRLTATPSRVVVGDTVRLRVEARDPAATGDPPRLAVLGPAGKRTETALAPRGGGRWEAGAIAGEPGLHRAVLQSAGAGEPTETLWVATDDAAETINVAADVNLMREIAQSTGGRSLLDRDAVTDASLLNLVGPPVDAAAEHPAAALGEHRPGWDRPWLLALMLALLSLEWLIRRRVGWR